MPSWFRTVIENLVQPDKVPRFYAPERSFAISSIIDIYPSINFVLFAFKESKHRHCWCSRSSSKQYVRICGSLEYICVTCLPMAILYICIKRIYSFCGFCLCKLVNQYIVYNAFDLAYFTKIYVIIHDSCIYLNKIVLG